MITATFKPSNFTSLLSFSEKFKTAGGSNSIPERAAMWLFQRLIRKHANEALLHRFLADNKKSQRQEGKFTRYYQMISYLLKTCVNQDVIAADEAKIVNLK